MSALCRQLQLRNAANVVVLKFIAIFAPRRRAQLSLASKNKIYTYTLNLLKRTANDRFRVRGKDKFYYQKPDSNGSNSFVDESKVVVETCALGL